MRSVTVINRKMKGIDRAMEQCAVLVLLAIFADQDIREQRLSFLWLLGAGGMGIIFWLCRRTIAWESLLGGIAVGAFLVLFAIFTKERIGIGDGILFCVTGIFLGMAENIILLMTAFLLAAGYAIILLVRKKCDRNSQIPFLPFVLGAYIVLLFR